MEPRVIATPEAAAMIQSLKIQFGPLMFHQSGGCCDGSQPMCFEKGDFKLGQIDVCIGQIEDCEFWMSKDQFEYWKHTQLIIHISKGRGSSFSLEIPSGFRFITQSRLLTEEELLDMEPLRFSAD
ncbi:MAG: DUF779 domain-containing protein [Sphingobacteriales bacterium]|nr:DUF779 domain-containing protein [Sphingobacteriales bacterium]